MINTVKPPNKRHRLQANIHPSDYESDINPRTKNPG